MTVQRDNLDVAGAEVVQEAESVLEGTPVVEPQPAPPTEVPRPKKEEDPEVTPQCCGQNPKFFAGSADLTTDGPTEHNADCPNHPDNLANEVLA